MHGHHRFEEPWTDDDRRGPGIRPERLLFEAALRGRGRGRGRGHPGAGFGRHGGMGAFGGPMFGRGPKVGRGDVRAAILALLSEKPMHGYQIITELSERSGGVWRPSPGSVYPTLQSLEDEGLIVADKAEGRRVFDLTVEGLKVAKEAGDGPAPWEDAAQDADRSLVDLRNLTFQVGAAIMQVAQAGSAEQIAKVHGILNDTRRKIYQVLAEDAPDQAAGDGA
jgi:DNA-binding PadR family transcriptional regulator